MSSEVRVFRVIGIGGSEVGVFGLIQGVLGVVGVGVELYGVEYFLLFEAEFVVYHGSATDVVHPEATPVSGPVGDGHAGKGVEELLKLFESVVCVVPSTCGDVENGYFLLFDDNLVGIVGIAFDGER